MQISWEKIPVFAGLNPDALQFLTSKATEMTVEAGQVVVSEGESGNRMFVIRSGTVKVSKSQSGGATTQIARLEAPDFFGEMCILETLPRVATVEAITETVLSSLSSIHFYQFYEQMPDQYSILILNIARDISRRLRKLDQVYAARS